MDKTINLENLIKSNDITQKKFEEVVNLSSMQSVLNYARANYIPVLLEDTAKLLFNVVYNLQPKNMLEIGTALGYSGTLLINASKTKLTTIENLESNYKLAKAHFEKFNLISNVNLIFLDAYLALLELKEQNKKFDFIFLDGPKGQYIKYLPILKELLTDGGILFADNVYFKGMVFLEGTIPHKKRTIVVNLRKFLQEVKNDKSLESKEFNIGDGVLIAKKLNN